MHPSRLVSLVLPAWIDLTLCVLLSAAVAPNGRMVATGSQDRTLKLWSAEDGGLQGVCRGHKRGIWSVAFSPVRMRHTQRGNRGGFHAVVPVLLWPFECGLWLVSSFRVCLVVFVFSVVSSSCPFVVSLFRRCVLRVGCAVLDCVAVFGSEDSHW